MINYTHLIAITGCPSLPLLKEYIDIALVSASYDISTAIFLNDNVVNFLQQKNSPLIEQSLNMAADFSISIFTDSSHQPTLYQQAVSVTSLSELQAQSKHHFIF